MSCDYCTKAQTEPNYPLYQAQCEGCKVRMLACGHAFWQSGQAGRVTAEYKRVLTLAFGDGWQAGHERIKTEADRQAAMKQGEEA